MDEYGMEMDEEMGEYDEDGNYLGPGSGMNGEGMEYGEEGEEMGVSRYNANKSLVWTFSRFWSSWGIRGTAEAWQNEKGPQRNHAHYQRVQS